MNENKAGQPVVSQVEIEVFAHSTENVEKVKEAVSALLPEPRPSGFKVKVVRGHYGNPIRLLTLTVSEKEGAYTAVRNLFSRLQGKPKAYIVNTLSERMDAKGNLYLRFDKQSTLLGALNLRDDDPIRVRIRFRKKTDIPSLRQEILRFILNK